MLKRKQKTLKNLGPGTYWIGPPESNINEDFRDLLYQRLSKVLPEPGPCSKYFRFDGNDGWAFKRENGRFFVCIQMSHKPLFETLKPRTPKSLPNKVWVVRFEETFTCYVEKGVPICGDFEFLNWELDPSCLCSSMVN